MLVQFLFTKGNHIHIILKKGLFKSCSTMQFLTLILIYYELFSYIELTLNY